METTAKINGIGLRVSTKYCVEISDYLRYKTVKQAKYILENVLNKKMAIPFRKHNRDVGHKPGMASGSYPVNATKEILNLLNGVEANAENKGLNKNELYISKMIANKGSCQWHPGRKRRRKMKNTHILIEVAEKKAEKKEAKKEVKK